MFANFKNIRNEHLFLYIIVIYFILSILFAFERILSVDNSYFFFQILDTQNFYFPENRFGILFSQIPIILAAKIGLPLYFMVYLYSIIFPIEYFLIAWICHQFLKVKEAAFAIAFSLIIGVAFSFFHPVTETYHALVFSGFLYAVLVSPVWVKYHKIIAYSSWLIVAILAIVSHPIGVFTVGFVTIFTFINKQIKLPVVLVLMAVILTALALRMMQSNKQSYDVQQYQNLFDNLKSFTHLSDFYPVLYIKTRLLGVYLSSIILLIVYVFMCIKSKQFLVLVFSLLAFTGFTLLAMLTFLKGDADIMMEKSFMPGLFMIVLPFSYLCFQKEYFQNKIIVSFTLIIAIISFVQIIKAANYPVKRLKKLEVVMEQQTYPKIIASYNDFENQDLLFNHWNTGLDSYILAKCKLQKESTIFLTDNKDTFTIDSTDSNLFLGPTWWTNWHTNTYKSNYFKLPEVPYHRYSANGKISQ